MNEPEVWEVDLADGSTKEITGTMEEATAEQARLNAQIQSAPPGAPRPKESMFQNTLDVLGEGAGAFNRSVMEGLDFMGPGTVNAGLRLAGSDHQLPTFAGAWSQTPGGQGGFMEPGTKRDAVLGFGAALPTAIGMTPVSRNLASPAQAAAEFLGLGAAKPQAAVPALAGMPDSVTTLNDLLPSWSPAVQNAGRLDDMARSGSTHIDRSRVAFDPYTGGAIPSPEAANAMKQGLGEKFTSIALGANDATKAKLRQMTDIQDKWRKDGIYAASNRPSDIVGDSLLKRVDVLRQVNQRARSQFNAVEESLKGQTVDFSVPVSNFTSEVKSMGLSGIYDPTTNRMVLDDVGSDIEGLSGPVKAIERTMNRMLSGEPGDMPDAYDIHRLKRFLDENLSWGARNVTGLDGNVERILRMLRHDLDGVLDDAFPAYNRVNTEYSETRQAMGAIEDAVGRRIDLTGPNADSALGTSLRTLLGNRQSRQMLTNSVAQVDQTAKKYAESLAQGSEIVPFRRGVLTPIDPPPNLDDDLLTQAMYASELESVFGSAAPNSFMGDLGKVMENSAVNAAASGSATATAATAAAGGTRALFNTVRGINEDNAMKAMRELLGMK